MNRYYGIFKKIKDSCPELINEYPLYYKEAADLYDQLSVDNNDVSFVMQQALMFGGPILELCSGSGRLTLPLLKLGLKITAVDLSDDMLSNLEAQLTKSKKYARLKKNLTIVSEDMTKLELNEKFNLIIIGATSIRLVEDDFAEFFNKMYELLNEGGCLFFDFENIPINKNENDAPEPMAVVDLPDKEKKLSLVCVQRIVNHQEERAFVNFLRVIPGSEEKVLLSYTEYRIFGIEDIKSAVERSNFGSCEMNNIPNSNTYFCKMVKK
ncbi:class I SAM-dependent methyltransferase [Clostridium saccharobutylicum]|uniref:Dimethyladenosine transferase n=1 Tax=Clostridium saccharobutylicum DSM 13864 TaxID=1345695 RepID=U5MPH8_CLOSA|nr:class I SAM-dependent methyltransferase [Clostridium saccharobutylicum]AGX41352.1 dimethyladenosine transferase [Clostridium saccharobutylicum DSM 13864]AQR88635.1 ubiquinone/menaquinone biosynthesis C-methyltransferase UbiE [Clostridium saccharobutylicum]AQR98533.1 ubiquinone/menaquinone biosynthesis C-methyltransferase UbiE [Clostridium saccharobutylicum]AQS08245.1 ubiquinone/menaquinone biosynthesis C-methyltransferase UbiE [Clostridium saccharobutylicum]AQS12523.1 ubiquinone/menaquinone